MRGVHSIIFTFATERVEHFDQTCACFRSKQHLLALNFHYHGSKEEGQEGREEGGQEDRKEEDLVLLSLTQQEPPSPEVFAFSFMDDARQ